MWHALRDDEPLIDLRLFTDRNFAAASGTLGLFAVAVFGSMLLLPLYFQTVRGEDAFTSGLLLAPQGLGAMVMMPIAGQLSDRMGVGRIVLPGLVLVLLAMLGLTQLEADTSYWLISADLFVFGLGMGATMMPIMTGALQSLKRAAIARGSTTLNIIQQVGASIGTAVLSVLLTDALFARLPGGGGSLGESQLLPPEVRAQIAPLMAEAFGATFWWALALLALAGAAAFMLPRSKPEATFDSDEEHHETPVMIGV